MHIQGKLVLCRGMGALLKETDLKPLCLPHPTAPRFISSVAHPSGCEMEHLCGLTWIFRRLVVMRISKEQTFVLE